MPRKPGRVISPPIARHDVATAAGYLAQAASLAVADRFLVEVEATLARLARAPELGTLWNSDDPRLAGVRVAPVSRFRRYLVFYRPLADGIEALRILHGARDLSGLVDPGGEAGN